MPHRLLVLSTALLGALAVVPAHAGSPDDPEVQADCVNEDATVSAGGEHVVCAAWFTTTGPRADQPRLTGTVQTQAELSARTEPVRVALTWRRDDGCREGWVLSDRLDAPVELRVQRECAGGGLLTADLDPARARFAGRDLTVELTDEDLARVGSSLAPGQRLSRPVAYSMVLLRSHVASVEVATGIQEAGPGRDYVVGST